MTWLRAQWDRAGATALCSLGVILLVVGWFGVSNTTYAAEQIPWVISCGIGGVFCLGIAATLWLSADLQDEWRKLDSLEGSLATMEQAVERSNALAVEPAPAALPIEQPVQQPVEIELEPYPEPAPLRVAARTTRPRAPRVAAMDETGPVPIAVPARRPRARTIKAG